MEKSNSVELNTFSTYLSSLLGMIAIVFSNHAKSEDKYVVKVFNLTGLHFFNVKNDFAYALQFFSLISDGLGGVFALLREKSI